MERKLAAILAADVAGYSRLMGADEEGTLNALWAHREVVDGLIAAHRGRVFNSAGDSVIAEFASAVEATLCAVEIQQEIGRRNAAVPKDKRLDFRIGINIGDVMAEGGNLFGDGVNVADRVQKLAEPGGICVARNVHDHLRNKADLRLEPMGEHQVKNIAAPVSVYRVLVPGAARRPLLQRWGVALRWHRRLAAAAVVLILLAAGGIAAWPLLNPAPPQRSGFPSLAVLPFEDFSGGAATAHYSDGVSEDLITALSRFPDITVVSRNSSFAYKGKEIDPVAVGRELNVDYVMEGSVQKKGGGLRINAQLIDTRTNLHVWTDGYDGTEASALQEDAVLKIIAAVPGEGGYVRRNEYKRTEGKARADFDPYDYYLSGHDVYYDAQTLDDLERAGAIWQEGLAKFPESNLLRLWVGWYHFWRPRDWDTPRPAVDYRRAGELAREALASPNLSRMERYLGVLLMTHIYWFEGDFVRAVGAAEEAFALNPKGAGQLSFMSRLQLAAGNTRRGLEWAQESTRLDPTIQRNTRMLAWAYYLNGEYEKSVEAAKTHELLSRSFAEDAYFYMIASYVRLGRLEEARIATKTLTQKVPWYTQITVRSSDLMFSYKDRSQLERELADVAQAGFPELPFGYDAKAIDRLTGDEIKTLLFGHTIRGRGVRGAGVFTDIITAEGEITETASWGSDYGTIVSLDDNLICYTFREWGSSCGAIFRKPDVKHDRYDEFIWVTPCCEYEFSVLK